MKKTRLMIVLAGVMAAPMAFAQSAPPGTGTITFNGMLLADTCEISPGDVDKTVTLPTLSAQSLAEAGQTAGSTMFTITVAKCPTSLSNVAAHFETTNMDPATRNAVNQATSNPASNVVVQLLDKDGTTPILLGSSGSFEPITGTGDTRGATMSYGGQYYATGQAGQGNVTAIVRYTLSYN
ncbi:major type 1 subunit fimbrin (pilin) [Paraburkholderia caballeronis]|nr:fimbrial protein [Paraburkholderia caballeronis]TDV16461.1 major type 1 subunit fimbrin (pilin) [Paraburkholderia caballeronis]TDV18857.1 major type 1 subunit fimbrin (pilin) [Paraburkholderia caballeronis]TDV26990.1 major type 1 subunit fimbrin (pilin) [Paraburkholderia caballeronis]